MTDRESIIRYLEHLATVRIGSIRLGALFTADQVPGVIASWIRNELDVKWHAEMADQNEEETT